MKNSATIKLLPKKRPATMRTPKLSASRTSAVMKSPNSNATSVLKVRRSTNAISFGSTRMPSGSFTPEERTILEGFQREKVQFVASPDFLRAGAERKIFTDAPVIAKPDITWYQPLLDERTPASNGTAIVRPPKSLVLTAAQERVIFAQLNYARFRVARTQRKAAREGMTTESARDMLHWHAVAEKIRKQIAETNLALVLAMAKRVRSADLDFGDLISEGNMALLRSVDKFDFGRGFKFSTYGCRAILKAYSRLGIKTQKHRQFFPVEFDPELERADHSGETRLARENDDITEVKNLVQSDRAGLSDIERTVIFHRYGLDRPVNASQLTLEQVGLILGVTKERVRQIQNKALEKIRLALISMNPSMAYSLPGIIGTPN